jgi:hypothetical protein
MLDNGVGARDGVIPLIKVKIPAPPAATTEKRQQSTTRIMTIIRMTLLREFIVYFLQK